MSLKNLDAMFNPQRIAVIGASEDETSIGCHLFRNLVGKGYPGIVHPVTEKAKGIQGVEAYPRVIDIPHPVDLALVTTEPEKLDAALNDCAQKGVKGIAILTPDLTSRLHPHKPLIDKIIKLPASSGCRVLGPSSLGFLRPAMNLNASLHPDMVQQGNIAFISECGIFASSFLETAIAKKVGFSYFISLGAKLDINIADTIDFLGSDRSTRAIFLFVQTINNGRQFMTAVRNAARTKPVVVIKPGKADVVTYLSLSDADPLSEEDLVYEAVFKRAGCLRVASIPDLLYLVETIAKQNRPRDRRLMIISNCIAPAEMAMDILQAMDGRAANPAPATLQKITDGLGRNETLSNPCYLLATGSAEAYRLAIETCLTDSEVDGLLVIYQPYPGIDADSIAKTVVGAFLANPRIPVFATWLGRERRLAEIDFLNSSGIPTYDTPEQAVKSFMYMYRYDYNLKLLQETPETLLKDFSPKLDDAIDVINRCKSARRSVPTDEERITILKSYGIPVAESRLVASVDEALFWGKKLGYPLVMKIDSLAIDCLRRNDITSVNLTGDEEVHSCYLQLQDRIAGSDCSTSGIRLQPMFRRRGYELIIGAHKTRSFGSVISFGLGGKYLQAERDYAIGLPPLNQTLARRMMEETKIYLYLQQQEQFLPGLRQLEEILVRFSQLVIDLPQLGAIYMNPIILTESECIVRDVVMHLDRNLPEKYQWVKGDLCPVHLSIPPYPFRYEKDVVLPSGTMIHIRPIRGEDEPALSRFFESLSPETTFYRFGQRQLNMPHTTLARFCQVDYDRDLAFLAVAGKEEEEIIADVRLNRFADLESAEFSFVVADHWQGMGVGRKLMEFCIGLAGDIGVKTLLMEIMTSNVKMIRFGYKFAFERLPGSSDDDMLEMQRAIP
jgi:acetyltransferase